MIEYKDFWTIVYDERDEIKIKQVVRKLNPIQVEEVIVHLVTEINRLRDENEKMKEILSHAVIIDGSKMN